MDPREKLRQKLGIDGNKIFVIGFHKCGGTTLHYLFLKNLLESHHQPDWGFTRGKNARGSFWSKFKAFSDGGDREDFAFLRAHHPDSLFILNCRPLKDWLVSRIKHGYHRKEQSLYPVDAAILQEWILRRQTHHLSVLNYFRGHPHNLIVVNIQRPQWLEFLCKESGLELYDLHANKSTNSVLPPEVLESFANELSIALQELGLPQSAAQAPCIVPGLKGFSQKRPIGILEQALIKDIRHYL